MSTAVANDTEGMPTDILCQITLLCSPWTRCCLAASCRALHRFVKEQNLVTPLRKYTGPVIIRDMSICSITATTFNFTCNSPYGRDDAAEQQLLLMIDYWLCKKKICVSSVAKALSSGRTLFTGRLLKSKFQEEKYRKTYKIDAGTLVDLEENWFYKDVEVYVSCNSHALRMDLRKVVSIYEAAKSWNRCQPVWVRDSLFQDYLVNLEPMTMWKFLAYRYLLEVTNADTAACYMSAFLLF